MTSVSEVQFTPVEVRTRTGRKLEVREYGFEDFGALVEMYKGFQPKRVAQGLPPVDVPRIAVWIDRLQNKSRFLLALHEKKVVGHTILCPMKEHCVEFTIFVHQDYREDGLGTSLSQATLEWAAEMGCPHVYLTTEFSNFPALGLFRKLGFQVTSSSGDECEMKLELTEIGKSLPRAA